MSSSANHISRNIRCDLFCRVIDNFGDAGVCWRLAKQLAAHRGWSVRLIIDQPGLIDRLHPDLQTRPMKVSLVEWNAANSTEQMPDVVIEAFGCHLPEGYLALLRSAQHKFVWINLEYLSAEGWIEGCHQLMSPDPASGKPKFFFFPGFTRLSGGLIYEPDLAPRLQKLRALESGRQWLRSIGITTREDERLVSLFAYPDSPTRQLFRQFRLGSHPVHCLIANTSDEQDLQKNIADAATEGVRVTRLPFLPQDDYDNLLASCDFNFVRGEDSFVRAQWAGKPFIWQIYRQQDKAHLVKLSAFLNRYLAKCESNVARSIFDLHLAWNDELAWRDGLWEKFAGNRDSVAGHNQQWADDLAANANLVENLAAFCESKL